MNKIKRFGIIVVATVMWIFARKAYEKSYSKLNSKYLALM
jgi:hypothetical protein